MAQEARTEEEQERLNRRLMELLNEIRVAMPGVQVLFGFLLTVHIIRVGTRLLILGLVALALAMNGAILLVCDVLFGKTTVVVTVVATTSVFAWLWFGMGLLRIRRES